jgi:hypothetical protein
MDHIKMYQYVRQGCTNPGRLNFVWWLLIFVSPHNATCYTSHFWVLEFWGSVTIFGKMRAPLAYVTLRSFLSLQSGNVSKCHLSLIILKSLRISQTEKQLNMKWGFHFFFKSVVRHMIFSTKYLVHLPYRCVKIHMSTFKISLIFMLFWLQLKRFDNSLLKFSTIRYHDKQLVALELLCVYSWTHTRTHISPPQSHSNIHRFLYTNCNLYTKPHPVSLSIYRPAIWIQTSILQIMRKKIT